MKKPKPFYIQGKYTYANFKVMTSDVASINFELFTPAELRRFAKWASKAADYLEHKARRF